MDEVLSLEEIIEAITASLAAEDGKRVAHIYSEVCGEQIEYEGDSIWRRGG